MAEARRVWWEKTVEYLFVSYFSSLAEGFVAPLDGDQERAGDAIFSLSNQWLLLEFKKDQSCLRREQEKYTNFDDAAFALGHKDHHHLLVYGFEDFNQNLRLTARTYFSRTQVDPTWTDDVTSRACSPDEFWAYLEEIRRFKIPSANQNGSSSGGLNLSNYSMVMGVNNNQATGCLSVEEFTLAHQKSIERTLSPGHRRTIEMPAPSIPPPPPQKTIERGGGRRH